MAGTKRKSAANQETSSSKKARIRDAKALVKAILANPDAYPILDDDDALRRQLIELAQYAKDLEEGELEEGGSQAGPAPKSMTPEQLQAAAEKLRKAANSGIKKQMTWRPSCKTGGSKWSYDGVCTDPLVFGTMLGLGGPPKFKMHKMPVTDFLNHIGNIDAHARYSSLYIKGDHVNIRWSDSGEFKFSGTYGA